jgi:hypothetical protein
VRLALDRREGFELPGPTAGVQPIPDIAAEANDTGEATRKVAESDRLYEIVEPTENRAGLGESGLSFCDRNHEKDGEAR